MNRFSPTDHTKFLIIVLLPLLLFSQIPQSTIIEGIELGIGEKYDQAIDLFADFAEKNPNDPAPHFFLATIWQTKMMDFETSSWQDLFFKEIDKTESLCDSILKVQPTDQSIQFYSAAALAYKSFQISREGNYLKGLRLALLAVKRLDAIIEKDSSFYDAYLGVGSYLYWRSYLTRNFSWLPFFHDQREQGITFIKKAFEYGTFSRWAALSNLAWIYIQEQDYENAIQCAQTGLAFFPNSRFFLWPLGDAHFKHRDFRAALEVYSSLMQSVTQEAFNNRYNETVLHLRIAKCHFELKDIDEAFRHAQQVFEMEPDVEVEKRIREKKKQARALMDKIKENADENVSSSAEKPRSKRLGGTTRESKLSVLPAKTSRSRTKPMKRERASNSQSTDASEINQEKNDRECRRRDISSLHFEWTAAAVRRKEA